MKIVALAGGVGGSKLADGLARLLPPEELTVVVNTGDDFEYIGLQICPDLDTVCYTLAGLANPETGWGLRGDTFRALEAVTALGGPGWFSLGDLDLATHLERTRRLKAGQPLSVVTRTFCQAWGVRTPVLPMSDQPVRTLVRVEGGGEIEFQEYFVHRRCEPRVLGFRFSGVEAARPAPGLLEAVREARAVVICPSNPWVSIDPILAVPGLRDALETRPVVAVSPIIAGKTVRGPAARMFAELGIQPSAESVARHYGSLLAAFLMDERDRALSGRIDVPVRAVPTLMKTPEDRLHLAEDVLHLVETL